MSKTMKTKAIYEEFEPLLPASLSIRVWQGHKRICSVSQFIKRTIEASNLDASIKSASKSIKTNDYFQGYGPTDIYLQNVRTFLELKSLIEGTEVDDAAAGGAAVTFNECLTWNLHILAEFVDTCACLIADEKLKCPTVKWLLEDRLIPILVQLAKIASLRLFKSGDTQLIECKIIEESLRWLRDRKLTLKKESLNAILRDVFGPLLSKSRKFADYDVHISKFSFIVSNFEGLCRCSDSCFMFGIIASLKLLSLNDDRVQNWALDELSRLERFPDSLLDVCISSFLAKDQWKRVLAILDEHAAPKAISDDKAQRRRAAWMFAISLEDNRERVHELLARHRKVLMRLLDDECPAVRREARLFWLRVGLSTDKRPEVALLVSLVVPKIIERFQAEDFSGAQVDFRLLRVSGFEMGEQKGAPVPAIARLTLTCTDWLALPLLQLSRERELDHKCKQFYENLQRVIPHLLSGKQLKSQLNRMVAMYEQLLSPDGAVWLEFNYVLLMTFLRLYLERPELAVGNWSRVVPPQRFYATAAVPIECSPFYAFKPFKQIKTVLEYSQQPIDGAAILSAIDSARSFMGPLYAEQPSLSIQSAKLIELLASKIHRQAMHGGQMDRLIWDRFEASLGDQVHDRYKIQMLMVVNYMSASERKRAHKDVMRVLARLDLAREPDGIHNRRVLLQLLSKYIRDFGDDSTELGKLIPMACKLAARLLRAYELRKAGDYARDERDCMTSCVEYAFATITDHERSPLYECEFKLFQDSLNRIEAKTMKQVSEALSANQQRELIRYRTARKLLEKTDLDGGETIINCTCNMTMLGLVATCPLVLEEDTRTVAARLRD